jgi:pyruvate,water dikinase
MEGVVYGFDELRRNDAELVGLKCANLGELTSAGFRVPRGFAVSLEGYSRFMNETGVRARIQQYLNSLDVDPDKAADMPRYEEASVAIRRMVEETAMPTDIETAIRERYQALCDAVGLKEVSVATRSAGPASHPGQYESYLHIRGADDVVAGVRRVWSSTFNQRSLIARARQGLDTSFDRIGAAVLQMVDAKAAGVMFTANPGDGDPDRIYIESNWGLGESVVGGEVTPDSFLVAKTGLEIIRRNIPEKKTWFTLDPATGKPSYQAVPDNKRTTPTLSDEEAIEIARVGALIEQHFGEAQDIEWAVDSKGAVPESIMYLQTRPARHLAEKKSAVDRIIDLMVRGLGSSGGNQ